MIRLNLINRLFEIVTTNFHITPTGKILVKEMLSQVSRVPSEPPFTQIEGWKYATICYRLGTHMPPRNIHMWLEACTHGKGWCSWWGCTRRGDNGLCKYHKTRSFWLQTTTPWLPPQLNQLILQYFHIFKLI